MSRADIGGATADPALAAAVEQLISDLSRLRARIDALGLPANDACHELSTHLALASMAALRLRLRSCEDDLLIEDR
jgi:hypothetical protein